MRLKESVEDGIDVFALQGEIDLHYAPVLRTLLQGKVRAETRALLLDLSGVDYIDSSGLATIIEYFRDAAKHAGIVCLVGMNSNLKTTFEIVRLDKAIPSFATTAEAIDALKRGAVLPPPTAFFKRSAA